MGSELQEQRWLVFEAKLKNIKLFHTHQNALKIAKSVPVELPVSEFGRISTR
jgi:hypothetical protein